MSWPKPLIVEQPTNEINRANRTITRRIFFAIYRPPKRAFLIVFISQLVGIVIPQLYDFRTGKEIRFRFGSSEDKAGKEAKRKPTGW
jgi:hypothetical protein